MKAGASMIQRADLLKPIFLPMLDFACDGPRMDAPTPAKIQPRPGSRMHRHFSHIGLRLFVTLSRFLPRAFVPSRDKMSRCFSVLR